MNQESIFDGRFRSRDCSGSADATDPRRSRAHPRPVGLARAAHFGGSVDKLVSVFVQGEPNCEMPSSGKTPRGPVVGDLWPAAILPDEGGVPASGTEGGPEKSAGKLCRSGKIGSLDSPTDSTPCLGADQVEQLWEAALQRLQEAMKSVSRDWESSEREEFRRWLEHLLVSFDDLREYVIVLNERFDGHFSCWVGLPPRKLDAVFDLGLEGLGEQDLMLLAVNPVALLQLSNEIYQRLPAIWMNPISLAGQRFWVESEAEQNADQQQQHRPSCTREAQRLAEGMAAGDGPTLDWSFCVPSDQIQLLKTTPTIGNVLQGEVYRVHACWHVGGRVLEVNFEPEYCRGPQTLLSVVWCNAAGQRLAAGQAENSWDPVRLAASSGQPQPGDQLEIRNVYHPGNSSPLALSEDLRSNEKSACPTGPLGNDMVGWELLTWVTFPESSTQLSSQQSS